MTSAILFISVASAVGFGHWLINTVRDLKSWYNAAIVADYLVRGSLPDSSFLLSSPIPEQFENELRATPGVARVDKISFLPAEVDGRAVLVLARTFAGDEPLPLDLREGDALEVCQRLRSGEVAVATVLAQKLGVHVGDAVDLESRFGKVKLRIAGIVTEYAAGGDALYLEWNAAKELLQFPGVHVFLVSAHPGLSEHLSWELRTFCFRHQLMLQSNAELKGHIDELLDRLTASLWVIVALIFVVASLGVVNTLSMNVIEQSRDLSLLRAIGMTGAQIHSFVVSQAILLAVVSLGIGAIAGVGVALMINESANAVFGQCVVFHFSWALTLGSFVVGVVITTLAARMPASQGVRVAVLAASGRG